MTTTLLDGKTKKRRRRKLGFSQTDSDGYLEAAEFGRASGFVARVKSVKTDLLTDSRWTVDVDAVFVVYGVMCAGIE